MTIVATPFLEKLSIFFILTPFACYPALTLCPASAQNTGFEAIYYDRRMSFPFNPKNRELADG